MSVPELAHQSAVLSPDGAYRYSLSRTWARGPQALFVMLNPSTADAFVNDPTILRCMSFAAGWGCGSLRVVNVFALRATNPASLVGHPDPVGPDADYWLSSSLSGAQIVVAAWGAGFPAEHAERVQHVRELCYAERALALGFTKSGHPRHPLYLRADTPLRMLPLRP